jgi:hypothetical protein
MRVARRRQSAQVHAKDAVFRRERARAMAYTGTSVKRRCKFGVKFVLALYSIIIATVACA